MVRIPTHRAPTHPGEVIVEDYLKPLGMTQVQLAERIHVPFQRVNTIAKGHRGITPDTALFGRQPAEPLGVDPADPRSAPVARAVNRPCFDRDHLA